MEEKDKIDIKSTDDELLEVINELPKEQREAVESLIFQSVQMQAMVSPESAMLKKIDGEHITKFLDASEKNMELSYKDRNNTRKAILIVVIASFVLVSFLVFMLKSNPETLEKVLFTIGGVIAGAFGGYGFGKHKQE